MSQHAKQCIRDFERAHPGAAELARYASLATRIDASLMRRLRLHMVPGLDAGAEADLWFSDLSQSRDGESLVLDPAVAALLRERLVAECLPDGSRALDVAYEHTRHLHLDWPASLQLEEELIYLALRHGSGAADRIEALLRPAIAAMASQEQRGVEISRWVVRAMPKLPEVVRYREAARALTLAAAAILGAEHDLFEGLEDCPLPADFGWLLPSASLAKRTRLRCEMRGREFVLHGASVNDPDERCIEMPSTRPLIVELRIIGGDKDSTRLLSVTLGAPVALPEGWQRIELLGLGGSGYAIERAPPPQVVPSVDLSYDVFIGHKSEHTPWVEWLGRSLQAAGRSVFLDLWNLVPGESWVEGLHRGLDNSRAAVLLATPDVINSGWIREEYNALLRRRQATPGFKLIPIVFGDIPNLPFLLDIQGIDCRDAGAFRRWFELLLCGLDGREPGAYPVYAGELLPPPPILGAAAAAAPLVPGEEAFVHRVMSRIGRPNCPMVMVTARGRRHLGALINALLDRGQADFGTGGVLHITPPFSANASTESCFAEIGRQCGFGQDAIKDANTFTAALDGLLAGGQRRFLLVTGFENAHREARQELAGALRAASEQHAAGLRIVLLGGEKLVEQKFATGKLSFLSHAEVQEWPDPSPSDVIRRQQADFPSLVLTDAQAAELLAVTGGHTGLVRWCLEQWDVQGGSDPSWDDWCYLCPELWETWYALAKTDADAMRASLSRIKFGPSLPWSPDATTRRLYWADLLGVQGKGLVWRAEVIRRVGREVLA